MKPGILLAVFIAVSLLYLLGCAGTRERGEAQHRLPSPWATLKQSTASEGYASSRP